MTTSSKDAPAVPPRDDDRDGLSFFTNAPRPTNASTVFGLPHADPLDRVFGDDPVVKDEAMGTTDLGQAAVAQTEMDQSPVDVPVVGSEAWKHAFILYGPPAPPTGVDHPGRTSLLARLRKNTGVRP